MYDKLSLRRTKYKMPGTVTASIKAALLVAIAVLCAAAQTTPHAIIKGPVPVFAVVQAEEGSPDTILDPVFLLSGSTILPFPDPCDTGPSKRAIFKRYLHPGARYSLVWGGATIGSAIVGTLDPNLFPESKVELQTRVPIHGADMALAVDPSIVVGKATLRRPPTARDRLRAERLTQSIFTARGVKPSELSRMEIDQLVVTPLISADPEIVVSASIKVPDRTGIEYSLFFVAFDKSDAADVVWYQHTKKEPEAQSLFIVDGFDAEAIAAPELIARRVFYEDYLYEVYQYRDGHWKKIFATGPYNCVAWLHPSTQ